MSTKFTENETESYYDAEDTVYRSIWDADGSVHWGVFDESTGSDFLKAGANLNHIMASRAGIDTNATVLDIGCGNGNACTWLYENYGCKAVGIDLSGVRVEGARGRLKTLAPNVQAHVSFEKASATDLPFEEGRFTHVWSQASFYHIPDKHKTLQEAYRVLATGGTLVFDDLIKPRPDISENAQTHVYDRLLFDTPFNFTTYQNALQETGFVVLEAHNYSHHLKLSYLHLSDVAAERIGGEHTERSRYLSHAYKQTALAVDTREIGWALYICRK